MSHISADWPTLVLTALGSAGVGSALGAVISTYGGRGRERREVRSNALTCLEGIEITRRASPDGEPASYDESRFAELNSKCLIAGVSPLIVATYEQICKAQSEADTRRNILSLYPPEILFFKSGAMRFAPDDAAKLLRNALWHPRQLLHRLKVKILRRKAAQLYDETWDAQPSSNVFYRTWRWKLFMFSLTGHTDLLPRILASPDRLSEVPTSGSE